MLPHAKAMENHKLIDMLQHMGETAAEASSHSEARSHYLRALRIAEQTVPEDNRIVAELANLLGLACQAPTALHAFDHSYVSEQGTGQLSEAHERFARARRIYERIAAPNGPDLAETITNIGDVYQESQSTSSNAPNDSEPHFSLCNPGPRRHGSSESRV